MRDLEQVYVAWNTSKKRVTIVAPNHLSLPIFEETNLAVDHNCLLMDVMQSGRASRFEYYCMKKNHSKALMVQGNTITGR
jgi:glutamine synthetase type III